MHVKSKNLKIRNLPQGHKRLDRINSKPYLFLCLFLLLGIFLLICKSYLLGMVFLVLFIYNFCFIKNLILVEFYDEYAVFYNVNQQKDECFILFWEDIAKWEYVHTKSDYDELEITLKNDKNARIRCIGKHKTLRFLRRFVNDDGCKASVSKKSIRNL